MRIAHRHRSRAHPGFKLLCRYEAAPQRAIGFLGTYRLFGHRAISQIPPQRRPRFFVSFRSNISSVRTAPVLVRKGITLCGDIRQSHLVCEMPSRRILPNSLEAIQFQPGASVRGGFPALGMQIAVGRRLLAGAGSRGTGLSCTVSDETKPEFCRSERRFPNLAEDPRVPTPCQRVRGRPKSATAAPAGCRSEPALHRRR